MGWSKENEPPGQQDDKSSGKQRFDPRRVPRIDQLTNQISDLLMLIKQHDAQIVGLLKADMQTAAKLTAETTAMKAQITRLSEQILSLAAEQEGFEERLSKLEEMTVPTSPQKAVLAKKVVHTPPTLETPGPPPIPVACYHRAACGAPAGPTVTYAPLCTGDHKKARDIEENVLILTGRNKDDEHPSRKIDFGSTSTEYAHASVLATAYPCSRRTRAFHCAGIPLRASRVGRANDCAATATVRFFRPRSSRRCSRRCSQGTPLRSFRSPSSSTRGPTRTRTSSWAGRCDSRPTRAPVLCAAHAAPIALARAAVTSCPPATTVSVRATRVACVDGTNRPLPSGVEEQLRLPGVRLGTVLVGSW